MIEQIRSRSEGPAGHSLEPEAHVIQGVGTICEEETRGWIEVKELRKATICIACYPAKIHPKIDDESFDLIQVEQFVDGAREEELGPGRLHPLEASRDPLRQWVGDLCRSQ